MERLTIEYCGEYIPKELGSLTRFGDVDDWDLCYGHCKAREDDGVDCEGCAISQCFNKLGEYEDLEESGKLLKLPCAIGDTVYEINCIRNSISEFMIIGFSISEHGIFVRWNLVSGDYRNLSGFNDSELGKTVFSTKEAAEVELKRLGG